MFEAFMKILNLPITCQNGDNIQSNTKTDNYRDGY